MVKKVLLNKFLAKILIHSVLKVHNLAYKLSTIFATVLNNNVHPKIDIIKYTQWFYGNIEKNDVVLDIGCNTGTMVDALSCKATYVYGIEIDKSLFNKAKSNVRKYNVEFICADATTYNYNNCKDITVITLSNVLEHIEHRVSFLNKITQQVPWNDKSNKTILIRVPMIDRDWISVYKKQNGFEYRLDKTHYTEYTYLQLEDELNKSNIKIVRHHVVFGELYAVCKYE